MTIYFIGIGPSIKYLSIKAIEVLGRVEKIYIDTYTNIIPDFSVETIRRYCRGDVEIVYADRTMLEGRGIDAIVREAMEKEIALLVPGDPFIATTHDAIRVEALAKGVEVRVVYGVSIYSLAASATGLQAYRFGKTVTLVYPRGFKPYSVVETIYDNLDRELHTLLLLDLRIDEGVAMTIGEAVEILLDLEREYGGDKLGDTIAVGLARLGTDNEYVKADLLPSLAKYNYPPPPHSIVVVAKPHPMELEALHLIADLPDNVYSKLLRKRI